LEVELEPEPPEDVLELDDDVWLELLEHALAIVITAAPATKSCHRIRFPMCTVLEVMCTLLAITIYFLSSDVTSRGWRDTGL
jgi:hypothetical protein